VVFNGSFSFNGSETGLDFADFLLGVPSSYTQGQAGSFYNRNLYAAAFLQDSWKATTQLTLNYGVRWDRDVYKRQSVPGRLHKIPHITAIVFKKLTRPSQHTTASTISTNGASKIAGIHNRNTGSQIRGQ